MQTPHTAEELLHRYVDGDLKAELASEVGAHIEQCPACAARHAALCTLRKHIALAAEENTRDVDFDALFARIERGISQTPAPSRREQVSVWTREQLEHRPARVWLPAAGVLAAAAAVLLFVRGGQRPIDDRPSAANPQIDIEQVAFNDDYGGTVFEVALADGASTKVVWINDYDDDDDDSEEVLQ